jgi:hypothetical protein
LAYIPSYKLASTLWPPFPQFAVLKEYKIFQYSLLPFDVLTGQQVLCCPGGAIFIVCGHWVHRINGNILKIHTDLDPALANTDLN